MLLPTFLSTFLSTGAFAQEAPRAQLERLRDIGRDSGQVRADSGESYRRLQLLADQIFGSGESARLTVSHHNDVGPFYRLIEVTYALDGQAIFHRRDESGYLGNGVLDIHDGLMSPGAHVLTVTLRYVGDGGAVVSYLGDYAIRLARSETIDAPAGQRIRIEVRTYNLGPEIPYQERLGLDLQGSTEALEAHPG